MSERWRRSAKYPWFVFRLCLSRANIIYKRLAKYQLEFGILNEEGSLPLQPDTKLCWEGRVTGLTGPCEM